MSPGSPLGEAPREASDQDASLETGAESVRPAIVMFFDGFVSNCLLADIDRIVDLPTEGNHRMLRKSTNNDLR